MLLRGMGMDLEEIRELEEIRRLWVEIPRERMKSRHDVKHIDREYILDPRRRGSWCWSSDT